MSKNVICNYFELRELLKLYAAIAEKDDDIAPLFSDLNVSVRKEEFIVTKSEDRPVFSRMRLSDLVKRRYRDVQAAFRAYYGAALPRV